MIEKSKKTQFDLFDIFILVAFSYRSIMVFFSAVFSRIPVIDVIGYQIVPLFVVAFAIICFMKGYFNGVKAKDFLFVLLILTVLLFSYLFHPENQPYYTQSNLQKIFVEAIPFFLLGLSFRCDKKTLKNLTIVSYIAIVLNSVYMFFYVGASATEGAYYMGQAYMLLPHVMFAINSVFDSSLIKSKFLSIVFTLFGFFFLTAMGTRGPLLIAAVYLMVKLVLTLDRKKTSQFYIIVGVICVVAWLIISGKYINILLWISDKISSLGMSTRAIDMLISNDYISHTSGRDSIFEMLWKKILKDRFWDMEYLAKVSLMLLHIILRLNFCCTMVSHWGY